MLALPIENHIWHVLHLAIGTFAWFGAEEALTIVLLNDFRRPSIIPWADNAAIARRRYMYSSFTSSQHFLETRH